MRPLSSIIILNYNSIKYTLKCVESVLDSDSFGEYEIIIIDNNSRGDDYSVLNKKFGNLNNVSVFKTGKNLGFAGGCNFGVKKARGDYVVLLNNDTVVDKGWLSELVKAISKDKSIGVVGSVEKGWWDGVTLNLIGYHISNVFDDKKQSLYAKGSSLIFRRELVDVPFDPDYFLYGEDVYLCWRLRLKGYKILIEPKSEIIHFGSVSSGGEESYTFIYYGERGRILNLLIFYEFKSLLKIMPMLILGIVIRGAASILKYDKNLIIRTKARLWIIRNIKLILRKRKDIQKERKVSDDEIFRYMTCKNIRGNSFVSRLINKISYLYCYLMGIKTKEFYDE